MTTTGRTRRLTATAVIAVLALGITAGCGTAEAESAGKDPALVRTDNGPVRGTVTPDVRQFSGIPYAKPPVDDLRWAAPQPADRWRDPLDATAAGDACFQPVDQPIAVPVDKQGPDCLNLNVTTPAGAGGKLPVIVWIHGGSFVYDSGASYGASELATQGEVVVVTLNYRLGAFGFLAHPQLADGGNFGLQDQRLALTWVRDNVDAFGGDPANVTIMGQSGGGYSVCAQLASPAAEGLFDRAIVQSAGCVGPDGTLPRDTAEAAGVELAEAVGCGQQEAALECLRGKDTQDIIAAAETGHEGFRPVAGTESLPKTPAEAFTTGEFTKVPVLYGSTHDEENGRIAGMEIYSGQATTAEDYRQRLDQVYGDDAAAVRAEYPMEDYQTPGQALGAVFTDADWSAKVHDTRIALAAHVRVYGYDFADTATPWFNGIDSVDWEVGSHHMVDLAYIFDYALFEPLSDSQQRLSREVIAYWAQFARDGDPNHKGAAKWKSFDKAQYVQALASGRHGIGRTDFVAEHHLDFWAGLAA